MSLNKFSPSRNGSTTETTWRTGWRKKGEKITHTARRDWERDWKIERGDLRQRRWKLLHKIQVTSLLVFAKRWVDNDLCWHILPLTAWSTAPSWPYRWSAGHKQRRHPACCSPSPPGAPGCGWSLPRRWPIGDNRERVTSFVIAVSLDPGPGEPHW